MSCNWCTKLATEMNKKLGASGVNSSLHFDKMTVVVNGHIVIGQNGNLSCDCKAYTFSKSPKMCKHTQAASAQFFGVNIPKTVNKRNKKAKTAVSNEELGIITIPSSERILDLMKRTEKDKLKYPIFFTGNPLDLSVPCTLMIETTVGINNFEEYKTETEEVEPQYDEEGNQTNADEEPYEYSDWFDRGSLDCESAYAEVTDGWSEKDFTKHKETYSEIEIKDYFRVNKWNGDSLKDVVKDGNLTFMNDRGGAMKCRISIQLNRALLPEELHHIAKAAFGQFSDGIGEGDFSIDGWSNDGNRCRGQLHIDSDFVKVGYE